MYFVINIVIDKGFNSNVGLNISVLELQFLELNSLQKLCDHV